MPQLVRLRDLSLGLLFIAPLTMVPSRCESANQPSHEVPEASRRVQTMLLQAEAVLAESRFEEADSIARGAFELAAPHAEFDATVVEWLLRAARKCYDLREPDKSEAYIREAYRRAKEIRGPRRHELEVDAGRALARRLNWEGEYAEAAHLWREAVAMAREPDGGGPLMLAKCLTGMAENFLSLDDVANGEKCAREAVTVRERNPGSGPEDMANALHALGWAMHMKGDLLAAEALYRRSLVTKQTGLGVDHPSVAFALDNLAWIYYQQSDYVTAEAMAREGLGILVKAYGKDNLDVARLKRTLSVILRAEQKNAESAALQREAFEMRRKRLGDNNPIVALSAQELGLMLIPPPENFAEADSLLLMALRINTRVFGPEHPLVSDTKYFLGYLNEVTDRFDEAEKWYREAVHAGPRASLETMSPWMVVAIARFLRWSGDAVYAESLLREAAREYDISRHRMSADPLRARQYSPYPDLAAVTLGAGRGGEAWVCVERSLARSLCDLIDAAEARKLSPSASAIEDSLATTLDDLESRWNALERVAKRDSATVAEREQTRLALSAAEEQWGRFQEQVADTRGVTQGDAYPLDRIQRSLDRQSVIIGWFDFATGLGKQRVFQRWAYLIRDHGPVVWARAATDSGAGALDPGEERTRYRDALVSPSRLALGMGPTARRMYEARIAPLEDALQGVKRIVVVPSGAMSGVPVEPMQDENGRYLGDRFTITYAPSATVYAWASEQSRDRRPSNGVNALLVGDPVFSDDRLAVRDGSTSAPGPDGEKPWLELSSVRSALAGNDTILAQLPRLPASRNEVQSIAKMSRHATVLLGTDASEQALVDLAESNSLRDYQVVHIATHTLIDPDQPERSALVLSQVGLPDPGEAAIAGRRVQTGMVSVKDILRFWKLDAELVTLSACETALGARVAGEGYVGFAHAFLQAGATRLLLSLWKVDDRATSLLMQRFYENFLGRGGKGARGRIARTMSAPSALKEAKEWLREYRDDTGETPFAHPYYWAGFVLIGVSD